MSKKSIPQIHHLLSMETLTPETITYLLNRAEYFLQNYLHKNKIADVFDGHVIVQLFFEPSTRTQYSFYLAATRLGAIVLNPNMSTSATLKGESLIDTVRTFEAMGSELFIIRHPDNFMPQFIASELRSNTSVINAGDGNNQHPTQALLDLLTISQHKKNFTTLNVAIVGDICHSRVARSVIQGLQIMGVPNIRLIAPESFMPKDIDTTKLELYDSLEQGLKYVDVIIALRIQKERMQDTDVPDPEEFFARYGVTTEKLVKAKKDVIIMHPGPMNRGVEIESSVADGPQSVILNQVLNGVAIRMAIIETLLYRNK